MLTFFLIMIKNNQKIAYHVLQDSFIKQILYNSFYYLIFFNIFRFHNIIVT